MISCQRATELISKQQDESLTAKEALELRVHLFICEFCEKFRQQLTIVRTALRKPPSDIPSEHEESSCIVAPDARERLKQRLKRRGGK